jgi:hypothetical protein
MNCHPTINASTGCAARVKEMEVDRYKIINNKSAAFKTLYKWEIENLYTTISTFNFMLSKPSIKCWGERRITYRSF